MLTSAQIREFERDGFVLVESCFSEREVRILCDRLDETVRDRVRSFDIRDSDGRASRLALRTDIRADVFGAVSASPRLVRSAQLLLGEDVYHWHSKVMLKEARRGGRWEWHQDFGYWHHDGCPEPRLVSAMVALDRADRGNGCLKVVVGSHKLSHLAHRRQGTQRGVDAGRIAAITEFLPVRYVEAEPGSVLWFDCCLLHGSEQNTSRRPRMAYICCYNALSNAPAFDSGHGEPVPVRLAADDAIVRRGRRR